MSRRRRGSNRRPRTAPPGSLPATTSSPRPPAGRRRSEPARANRFGGPLWFAVGTFVVAAVLLVVVVVRPFDGPAASAGPSVAPSGSAVAGGGCPTSQPAPLAAGETRVVAIETELGPIEVAVQADLSPIAAGNFVALAACGFYDGVVFHRTPTLQDGTPFVIQGGDPEGTGTGGPGYQIMDEPVSTPYGRGTVAMARSSRPNSVGSQFFIVLDDGARGILEQFNTYQIIGSVTAGMETADAIHAAAGGQELPTDPVTMTSVTVRTP